MRILCPPPPPHTTTTTNMRTDNNGEQQWEPYASSILWAFIRSPRLGTSRNTVCGSCAAAGTIFMGLLAIFERPEDGYKLLGIIGLFDFMGLLFGVPSCGPPKNPICGSCAGAGTISWDCWSFLIDKKMVTNYGNHRLARFHGSAIRSPKLGPSRGPHLRNLCGRRYDFMGLLVIF